MDFGARTGGTKAATKAPASVKAVAAKKKATAKKKAKKHAAVHCHEAEGKGQADEPPAPDPSSDAPYEPPVAGSPDPLDAAAFGHRPDERRGRLHPEARSSLPCRRRPSRHRLLPSPSLL